MNIGQSFTSISRAGTKSFKLLTQTYLSSILNKIYKPTISIEHTRLVLQELFSTEEIVEQHVQRLTTMKWEDNLENVS